MATRLFYAVLDADDSVLQVFRSPHAANRYREGLDDCDDTTIVVVHELDELNAQEQTIRVHRANSEKTRS